jgi:hypothetical protein
MLLILPLLVVDVLRKLGISCYVRPGSEKSLGPPLIARYYE